MIENEQKLLAQIIDIFARKFDRNAILCGGMVLRILGSPRLTNDLDYAFVPFKSKKDIVNDVVSCLKQIPGAEIRHSMNSQCLRILISVDETTVQVEVKTAMKMATSTATTRLLSPLFNLPPRTIKILDFPVAMANKMAAWNERRLFRDIYDIWFFIRMNVEPDIEILSARLKKPNYAKRIRESEYFKGKTTDDFFNFLRDHCKDLTDADIEKELADYLPPDEITGLADMFRAAFARL